LLSILVLDMIEIIPPLEKYKYDTWKILSMKCYIDNSMRLRSCIRNINRLEHDKKVTFFNCHRRFLPLNHSFRSDRRSFIKGETGKGPPKQKFRADIMKALDDLKESENGVFKCYSKSNN
jgi:hypothetical protein